MRVQRPTNASRSRCCHRFDSLEIINCSNTPLQRSRAPLDRGP